MDPQKPRKVTLPRQANLRGGERPEMRLTSDALFNARQEHKHGVCGYAQMRPS